MSNITSSSDLSNKIVDLTNSVSLQIQSEQHDDIREIIEKFSSEKNSIKDISSVGSSNSFNENCQISDSN